MAAVKEIGTSSPADILSMFVAGNRVYMRDRSSSRGVIIVYDADHSTIENIDPGLDVTGTETVVLMDVIVADEWHIIRIEHSERGTFILQADPSTTTFTVIQTAQIPSDSFIAFMGRRIYATTEVNETAIVFSFPVGTTDVQLNDSDTVVYLPVIDGIVVSTWGSIGYLTPSSSGVIMTCDLKVQRGSSTREVTRLCSLDEDSKQIQPMNPGMDYGHRDFAISHTDRVGSRIPYSWQLDAFYVCGRMVGQA